MSDRRSITMSCATYERIAHAAEARGISMSSLVEAMIDEATGAPPHVTAPMAGAVMREPLPIAPPTSPPIPAKAFCAICLSTEHELVVADDGKLECVRCREEHPRAGRISFDEDRTLGRCSSKQAWALGWKHRRGGS